MRFDIITIFPKIFDSYVSESILKRARAKKLVDIRIHNLRDFSRDKRHRKVDDKPYGGGAGMVLAAEPILRAVDPLFGGVISEKRKKSKIVVLSAKGRQFNQKLAYAWAKKYDRIILISGRYEGIDERVKTALRAEEISVGPYILTDGDVAAMVVISAVSRLLPGVIKLESLAEESFTKSFQVPSSLRRQSYGASATKFQVQKEYPHYTRPEVLKYKGKKYRVPRILLSGDHKKIEEWRKKSRRLNGS